MKHNYDHPQFRMNGSRTNKIKRPIYTFDIETDPFEYGADIKPFACGLYDGNKFVYTWQSSKKTDCIADMKQVLNNMEPGIIYAHNGGCFDMYFALDWFANEQDMLIINNRIVKANVTRYKGSTQCHEFRDSYAIMPFRLKTYKKEEVDYRTFTKQYREKHKREIVKYLRADCVYLHELVTDFWEKFGDNLTIGSTAMKHLKKLHPFERLDVREDERIRTAYFYGGRVQCFERGIIKPSTKDAKIIAYDLNQCYPHVMCNMLHPMGKPNNVVGNEITTKTGFVTVKGINHNAFPIRTDDGLRFNKKRGIFSVSIHEYNAAVECGMFETEDILECIDFEHWGCFDKFVKKYHTLRKQAQQTNDERGALFYKFIGNSAYGKFAQNPDNYFNYKLVDDSVTLNPDPKNNDTGWYVASWIEFAQCKVWKQRTHSEHRYNVAIGASITGGARSLLIRAISKAQRPLYCDTDSLMCEGLGDASLIHPTNLGCWKVEATGNQLAIGGRKLYALFGDRCPKCNGIRSEYNGKCKNESERHDFHSTGCLKDAHKGAPLFTPQQIVKVARGATIVSYKESPTFNLLKHTMTYMSRKIGMTTTDVIEDDNDEYGD